MFSRHRISPFFILAMASTAFGPMQSSAKATGRLTMRATSAATGLSESFGSNPFGRLRCDSKITLPPLSASSVMVGTISSMRVASATLPSCIGTLRSTRNKTRLPLTSASSRLRKAFMAGTMRNLRSDDLQASLPIATAVSTMRLEKPHSLSYHDITRTSVPSSTLVWSMWKTDECGSWLKSLETLGSSV